MKKIKHPIIIVFLIFSLSLTISGKPEENTNDITFTWQDLVKLLDLDSDKIKMTWPEFRKLMAQTGNQLDMSVNIDEGILSIKRDQFKRILDQMKPFVRKIPPPPEDYLISEAIYKGSADEKNCRFTAEFTVFLFEKNSPKYIEIPILSTSAALLNVFIDGAPAVIHTGTWYYISLQKSGFHKVKVVFSISRKKQSISLPVVHSVINRIDISVPEKDSNITINPSINPRLEYLTDKTRITANMPPANQVDINWSWRLEKKEKKPALIYAHTNSLVSVDTDILKVKTNVNLEIIQSSLDNISLLVPWNIEIVKVEAGSGTNWQVRETGIGRVLEIRFGYDINDSFNFTVYAERILAPGASGVDFPGFQVIDARRETGNLGIVAESAVEIEVQEVRELEKLVFHKLPRGILKMSPRPILYSYKYKSHPFHLFISIHKHERLEGMTTVIESAKSVVLFLVEGKMLYQVIYTVRNSFTQFMELELPENAVIWTVLVDNKREKASRSKEGKILIPLVRSPGKGDRLKSFQIELTYTLPIKKFGLKGSCECFLPTCNIFINKMRLSLFCPEGYSYNFNKEEWKEVLKPVETKKRTKMVTGPSAPKKPAGRALKIASNRQPKLIRRILPAYPDAALKSQMSGEVVIEAVTDIYGRVIKATVITGHPLLRHAAREAVLQWVYEPYIVNGIPRPAQFSVMVHFDYKKRIGMEEKGRQCAACIVTPIEIPDEKVEDENKAFGIEGGVVEGVLGGIIGGVNGGPIIPGKPGSKDQDKVNRTQTVITGPVGLKSVKVHLPLSGKKYMFFKKMIDKGETYSFRLSFFSIRLKNTLIYLFILLILITMTLIVYKKAKKRV